MVLSSFMIYNSVGPIDENAINGLQLIINLVKNIWQDVDLELPSLL